MLCGYVNYHLWIFYITAKSSHPQHVSSGPVHYAVWQLDLRVCGELVEESGNIKTMKHHPGPRLGDDDIIVTPTPHSSARASI